MGSRFLRGPARRLFFRGARGPPLEEPQHPAVTIYIRERKNPGGDDGDATIDLEDVLSRIRSMHKVPTLKVYLGFDGLSKIYLKIT